MANNNLAVKSINNIIKIHYNNMVERAINLFLENSFLSEKTKSEYKRDILNFFDVKNINEITDKMIRDSNDAQSAREYFNNLEGVYASSTISRKLSTIKCLYNYILGDGVKGNDGKLLLSNNVYSNLRIPVKPNPYGSFTFDEVVKLLDIASEEDGLYYELLGKTSVRKEATRKLHVKDLIKKDGIWCVHGFDKAKRGIPDEFIIAVGEDIYNRCIKIADDNGRIFNFGKNTPLNRLRGSNGHYEKGYCYRIGISKEEYKDRNLCLHSFKKTGGILIADITNGNTKKIMEQCRNGAEYAMKTYQEQVKNHQNDTSNLIEFRNRDLDRELADKLRELSNYELREIILGLNKGAKDSILNKLIGSAII